MARTPRPAKAKSKKTATSTPNPAELLRGRSDAYDVDELRPIFDRLHTELAALGAEQPSEWLDLAKLYLEGLSHGLEFVPSKGSAFWVKGAVNLGFALSRVGYVPLETVWDNELRRRAASGRKRVIDPAHVADLRTRADNLRRDNPNWSERKIVDDNILWYRLEHKRKVSESTMRRALRQN